MRNERRVRTKLLKEITFDKIRPFINTSSTRIRPWNVDYVVSLTIHKIRKVVRDSV